MDSTTKGIPGTKGGRRYILVGACGKSEGRGGKKGFYHKCGPCGPVLEMTVDICICLSGPLLAVQSTLTLKVCFTNEKHPE